MLETGYRALKKRLNKYHKFTFDLPRKGKKLSPNQKRAITIKAQQILAHIKRVDRGETTFLKKIKGVSLKSMPQSGHSNKGVFYPSPGALLKIKKVKGRKIVKLEIRYKHLIEKFFPFPVDILGNMELIEMFVEGLVKRYKPKYVMWSVNDFQGKIRYTPEGFNRYAKELIMSKQFKKDFDDMHAQGEDFLNGVFLGYREEA